MTKRGSSLPASALARASGAAQPTFSVVIATYQAADTVGDAVASALAQTRPPHEVIVVDDGSTDDLDRALVPFGDRITLIRKENGGGASALNAALGVASGDFYAILDADDVYRPQRLAVLTELAAARPELDILTTDAELVFGGRSVARLSAQMPFVADDQRAGILRACFVGAAPAVRTSRLRAIGGFDEALRIAYDWDCWLRLILDGSIAGYVDEPLLEYRQHSGSLTANRIDALWARVHLLEKAEGNVTVSDGERRILSQSLRYHRTRAVLAEAARALGDGTGSHRVLLRAAVQHGIEPGARAMLALAATGPAARRRWLPRDPGALEQRFATPAA
jgi:glycosyltransferase involved in cell wall biosynthesis